MSRTDHEARSPGRASVIPSGRDRRGIGIPVIVAMTLPLIIFVGALAISYKSSSTRRQTASFYMSYLALELAESAIAEAAHNIRLRDVFDVSRFGNTDDPRWPRYFMRQMIFDGANDEIRQIAGNPPRLPEELEKEYRNIYVDSSPPKLHHRMLVGLKFPPVSAEWPWRRVSSPGAIRDVAAENDGVVVEDANDLAVFVRPISFRREYYPEPPGFPTDASKRALKDAYSNHWVNWGVLQFRVQVRVRDFRGVSVHELRADRRFTLRFDGPQGEEQMFISPTNLRSFVTEVKEEATADVLDPADFPLPENAFPSPPGDDDAPNESPGTAG